ncbi:MAG: hypothetical protein V1872_09315, partial [bacterium]
MSEKFTKGFTEYLQNLCFVRWSSLFEFSKLASLNCLTRFAQTEAILREAALRKFIKSLLITH